MKDVNDSNDRFHKWQIWIHQMADAKSRFTETNGRLNRWIAYSKNDLKKEQI
jgi:hypothetical protein